MNPITQYVGIALGVVLICSLTANAYFWHERDKAIEAQAVARELNKNTLAAASQCSESVEALKEDSVKRGKRLEDLMAGIAPQVRRDQSSAIKALSATADDAKDLCGSLARFWRGEIKRDRELFPPEQPQEVKP